MSRAERRDLIRVWVEGEKKPGQVRGTGLRTS